MDLVILKDINCLNNYKFSFLKKKKILAFDWRVFYYLKNKKFNIIFAENIFPFEKYQIFKKRNDNKVKKIIKFLNKDLFSRNSFIKKKNWKFYNNLFLEIKEIIDTTHYVNIVLSKVFKKFNINRIYIIKYSNDYSLSFDNKNYSSVDFVLDNNNIFRNVVKEIKYVKLDQGKDHYSGKTNNLFVFSKNLIKFFLFFLKPTFKKDKLFVLFSRNNFFKSLNNLNFLDHFLPIIKNQNYKPNFEKKLIVNNNLNLEKLLNSFVLEKSKIIFSCIFFYGFYKLKLKNYKLVFFKYCSGRHPIFILLKQLCDDLKIKYSSWSHGFYGVTKSYHGWEYSDFHNVKNIGYSGILANRKAFKSNYFFNVGLIPEDQHSNVHLKKKK